MFVHVASAARAVEPCAVLSSGARAKVLEQNALDVELYDFALALFEQRLAALRRAAAFAGVV